MKNGPTSPATARPHSRSSRRASRRCSTRRCRRLDAEHRLAHREGRCPGSRGEAMHFCVGNRRRARDGGKGQAGEEAHAAHGIAASPGARTNRAKGGPVDRHRTAVADDALQCLDERHHRVSLLTCRVRPSRSLWGTASGVVHGPCQPYATRSSPRISPRAPDEDRRDNVDDHRDGSERAAAQLPDDPGDQWQQRDQTDAQPRRSRPVPTASNASRTQHVDHCVSETPSAHTPGARSCPCQSSPSTITPISHASTATASDPSGHRRPPTCDPLAVLSRGRAPSPRLARLALDRTEATSHRAAAASTRSAVSA